MEYKQRIQTLIEQVPLVDLTVPRERGRMPTQASSEFTTNREQGDWAEKVIQRAINQSAKNYIAVRYGKSDDRVAGEEGFTVFFSDFQDELDTIGKRPDLLLFRRGDFPLDWGDDISRRPTAEIEHIVSKAIAGFEVRSSAFLIDRYEAAMKGRIAEHTKKALEVRRHILDNYTDLLDNPGKSSYLNLLQNLDETTLSILDFKKPAWRSSPRLVEVSQLFGQFKDALKELKKRNFLSITPKVEDLKVVHQWIQVYNVPHFYMQVFFDKAYSIAYEQILSIISDEANEGVLFFTEGDVKNQNKVTVKINPREGVEIAAKVDLPEHRSKLKELDRGRLLYYVTFEGGTAYMNLENLCASLGINPADF